MPPKKAESSSGSTTSSPAASASPVQQQQQSQPKPKPKPQQRPQSANPPEAGGPAAPQRTVPLPHKEKPLPADGAAAGPAQQQQQQQLGEQPQRGAGSARGKQIVPPHLYQPPQRRLSQEPQGVAQMKDQPAPSADSTPAPLPQRQTKPQKNRGDHPPSANGDAAAPQERQPRPPKTQSDRQPAAATEPSPHLPSREEDRQGAPQERQQRQPRPPKNQARTLPAAAAGGDQPVASNGDAPVQSQQQPRPQQQRQPRPPKNQGDRQEAGAPQDQQPPAQQQQQQRQPRPPKTQGDRPQPVVSPEAGALQGQLPQQQQRQAGPQKNQGDRPVDAAPQQQPQQRPPKKSQERPQTAEVKASGPPPQEPSSRPQTAAGGRPSTAPADAAPREKQNQRKPKKQGGDGEQTQRAQGGGRAQGEGLTPEAPRSQGRQKKDAPPPPPPVAAPPPAPAPAPTPAPEVPDTSFTGVLKKYLEGFWSDDEGLTMLNDSLLEVTVAKAMAAKLPEKLSIASKHKNNLIRTRACNVLQLLVHHHGRAAEPLLSLVIPSIFELVCDKVRPVATLAVEVFTEIQTLILQNPDSTAAMLDPLMSGLANACKSPVKMLVLKYVIGMAEVAPKQLGHTLGRLIPYLTDLLHDTDSQIKEAAVTALTASCGVCDNNDLRPFMPLLINALGNPEQITECIHSLASLTFVQVVDASALGILVPLLSRGFKERKVPIVRCTAVIITNVSKLTDDPKDAKYLLELLPACRKAAEEVALAEARGVCLKAVEQMERIEIAVRAAAPEIDVKAMSKLLKPVFPPSAANCSNTLRWISAMCCSLAYVKCWDALRWEDAIIPFVKLTNSALNVDEIVAVAKKARALVAKDLQTAEVEENDDAEVLCDCKFTLAYGTKILLHNTDLKIKRGYRYGLLGGNDCGKSTLLRAIANEQIEGLPPASQLRTVFVEADIQGEMSHLPVLDYVFTDDRIIKAGISREDVASAMLQVGFTEKMLGDPITTLSGGWRMKLALSRAMLQKADLLLCDEPTNHLDVINVAWLENYLCSLTDVTSIIVSHNAGLLDKCCTHMLHIENLKLALHKGNLSSFVERYPAARSFFELSASKLTFKFPQPSFIEGVRSKGKALMKMESVSFTYPGNPAPTLRDVTVQVSLASRVACVGVNGAGKSTMIKLLTGELQPCSGSVWVHPSARIAYVAQHAFHHIEQHLKKSANEYIAWRYQYGEDKEALRKVTLVLTEEEEKKIKEPVSVDIPLSDGSTKKEKRVIADLTGGRRKTRVGFEYEVKFQGMSVDHNLFIAGEKLEQWGFAKIIKQTDTLVEAREGMYQRPLTQANIEKHIADVGLAPEFATHTRMGALSGGQKVKVVLAAAMWNQPHILVVDEPTNYLDRESLGALANAIKEYEGGIVMITHNEEFAHTLCPETWVLENGRLDCKGDAEWMRSALAEKVDFKMMEEMVDGAGNVIKVKQAKKVLSRKEQKAQDKRRKARKDMGEKTDSEED